MLFAEVHMSLMWH